MGDVKIGITGDNTGLIAAVTEAKAVVESGADAMAAALERVAAAAEMINTALLVVAAVLAGGKAFSEAVKVSQDAAIGAQQLARALGITATQASVLNVAMAETHVSTEAVTSASNKIATTLKKNENAFKELGVATRDANGNFRNSFDIMTDVNGKLSEFKEGTDRNVEGQKIYGRGWAEIAPSIRLTATAMQEAQERAQALGLIVGVEGLKQANDYRDAMAGVHSVFDGILKAIGDALMPALTAMGQWFESIGPQAVALTKSAIVGLVAVYQNLKAAAETVIEFTIGLWDGLSLRVQRVANFIGTLFTPAYNILKNVAESVLNALIQVWEDAIAPFKLAFELLKQITGQFSIFKEAGAAAVSFLGDAWNVFAATVSRAINFIAKALHLDLGGAKAAWAAGTTEIDAASKRHADNIKKDWTEAAAVIAAQQKKMFSQETPTSEGTGAASSGGDGTEKSQLAALEAVLEQRKAAFGAEQAAEGSLREFGKQQEVDYWQSILNTTKVSANDRIAILKKIAIDEQAIQKQATLGALAQLKAQGDEQKDSLAMRLSLEYEYAAKVMQAYGADSKEYAAAQKSIVDTKRATVEQLKQADEIRSQTARTIALNEVQADEDAARLKYDNGRLSLDQYLALETQFENKKYDLKREELEKELALEALSTDNPVKKAQLDQQLQALESTHQAAMFKIQQQAQGQLNSLYKNVTNTLSSSFASAFQGVIQHTQTMGQAVRSVFTSLLSTIIQFFAQWAAKALVQHIIAMTQNKQEAASNAAVAATGGAKSAAAIPYVGWAIAIGAAAAIFAAASSYSAAGGFDVPGGLNPMTQLHGGEMVLPQPLAQGVRNMVAGGGADQDAGGGSGGDMHMHWPGKNIGGGWMMTHQDDIAEVVKHLYRRGKL